MGLKKISRILANSNIEYIFPMSLQVNYWLQKLGLYESDNEFLEVIKPSKCGVVFNKPFFEVEKWGTFKLICGNVYSINNNKHQIIPILHSNQFPLQGKIKIAYEPRYKKIKEYFRKI